MGPRGEMLKQVQHDVEKGMLFLKTFLYVKEYNEIREGQVMRGPWIFFFMQH
jgi:hypothetical protein